MESKYFRRQLKLILKTFFVTAMMLTTVLSSIANAEVSVMGAVLVGDPYAPDAAHSKDAWIQFEKQLLIAKANGIQSISTDIWWGLVEGQKGAFEWRYYEKMAEIISKVGLQWNPILSFHQLGGNVGDKGYIPLPDWVWHQGYYSTGSTDSTQLMFKSENGNLSKEYVSFWATDILKPRYEWFMIAFRANFSKYSNIINEIHVSLGPTGKLSYPSYHVHDGPSAGYPNRGAIQAYSDLAIKDFRHWMKNKYQTIENLNKAWNSHLNSFNQLNPPDQNELKHGFYENNQHFSPYGKDFFDWYQETLISHSQKMISVAQDVFHSSDSPMPHVSIGVKIPGIHWRAGGDRLAELNAGLIKTSYKNWNSDQTDFGYRDLLKAFSSQKSKLVVYYTATELPNRTYEGHLKVDSLAETLTQKIGEASIKYNFHLKGENALPWSLQDPQSFQRMQNALTRFGYKGMTLLRLDEITNNNGILERIRSMHKLTLQKNSCQALF